MQGTNWRSGLWDMQGATNFRWSRKAQYLIRAARVRDIFANFFKFSDSGAGKGFFNVKLPVYSTRSAIERMLFVESTGATRGQANLELDMLFRTAFKVPNLQSRLREAGEAGEPVRVDHAIRNIALRTGLVNFAHSFIYESIPAAVLTSTSHIIAAKIYVKLSTNSCIAICERSCDSSSPACSYLPRSCTRTMFRVLAARAE